MRPKICENLRTGSFNPKFSSYTNQRNGHGNARTLLNFCAAPLSYFDYKIDIEISIYRKCSAVI